MRRTDLVASLALVVLVFITFSPVRHYGYVRYDDDIYIFDNPHARQGLTPASAKWAVTHLVLSNYMPLPVLSLLADVTLWGMNPVPMHVENVILHGLGTIGWYLVWVTLTGRRLRSFMVAALFGVHPMHVEAVAWISVRGDLLCMPLMLGSLLTYIGFVRTSRKSLYALSIGLLLLAVIAKTLAMVFPGILLLLNAWPLRRIQSRERPKVSAAANNKTNESVVSYGSLIFELAPFVTVAAFAASLGLATRGAMRTTASLQSWPIHYRIVNIVFGYSTYLLKLFWPEPMIVEYPLRTAYSDAAVAAALGLLILITVITVRHFHRRPYLLVGWLWFLGTLLPTIGFVQAGMYSLADRYTYVPYIGLTMAIVWWIGDLWTAATVRLAIVRLPIAITVCGLVLLACTVDSRRQIHYWSSSLALWTHAYSVAPDNARILKSVGTEYRLASQFDLATEAYAQSVKADPTDPGAEAELANMLLRLPDGPARALPHYLRATVLGPKIPYLWVDLALCRQQLNQFAAARENYRMALSLDGGNLPARQALDSLPAAEARYHTEMLKVPR